MVRHFEFPPLVELLVVEQTAEPLLERLDPPRRAVVVMALLALVLVGVFLVAAVMIGAHWVRRLARHGHGRTTTPNSGENRRLRQALRPILPEGNAGETTVADKPTDDTVAEP